MPSPRNSSISAARAINVAVTLVEQQQEQLRAIIESTQSRPEEKFQALVDLAHLAGILLHEMAVAEEIPD
jgi:predicted nucleotidyltransferase